MHQHYQNELTLHQEQKSILNLTEDKTFSDNMEHLLITNILSGYYFLALFYEINLRNYCISSNKHP